MKTRKKFLTGCALASMLCMATAHAQSTSLEYQVKASYLYNFIQYITWPNDVFAIDGKFNLCVVGAERFGAALNVFTGERIEGHEIAIRQLIRPTQAQAAHCHLLFIADDDGAIAEEIAGQHGLLVIGETPGFLERGGIINLVEMHGRIRFEISQQMAKRADLIVSSRILTLAINKP